MKIYWGLKDVPELAGLSRTERRKVWGDCYIEFRGGLWQFWVGYLAMFVFAGLGGVTGDTLHEEFGFSATVEYACWFTGLMFGWLIYFLFYYSVLLDRLRPHFRDYLAKRKVHV